METTEAFLGCIEAFLVENFYKGIDIIDKFRSSIPEVLSRALIMQRRPIESFILTKSSFRIHSREISKNDIIFAVEDL